MTREEAQKLQATVKSPNQCMPGDPDLAIWWACQAVLNPDTSVAKPGIDIMEVIDADDDTPTEALHRAEYEAHASHDDRLANPDCPVCHPGR